MHHTHFAGGEPQPEAGGNPLGTNYEALAGAAQSLHDSETAARRFTSRPSAPLEGTKWGKEAIQRVKYTHDAMIDLIIVDPGISQGQIAKHFGYTEAWVSRIFGSDAFQARLAQRKADIIDPTLVASVEERLKGVAMRSLDLVMEKLNTPSLVTLEQAMKAVEMSTKALGYGARQQNVAVQTSFVVALPPQAASAADWAAQCTPGGVAVSGGDALPVPPRYPKIPGIESPELASLVEVIDVPQSSAGLGVEIGGAQ